MCVWCVSVDASIVGPFSRIMGLFCSDYGSLLLLRRRSKYGELSQLVKHESAVLFVGPSLLL